MKKFTLKDLKNAQIPLSRSFKAGLKENLLARAEKQFSSAPRTNPFMKTLFRLSISFAVIALLVTQVVLPGESTSTLQTFIQEASAANEAHVDEIYHTSIVLSQEVYFDNPGTFTGWQTVTEMEKDMWIAPDGSLREEIQSIAWNGPNENGVFEEAHMESTSLYLKDDYDNFIDYTLLEITGTELVEKDGEMVEEPTYNVHPGKQHNAADLQEDFLNQITCINSEEAQDFTGYAWATLNERDSSLVELNGVAHANEEKYNLMDDLAMAADGRMSVEQVIALFETFQGDSNVTYEIKEVEGKQQHVIQLNQKGFSPTYSNSPEGLKDLDSMDVFVTFYFDAETYRLTKMTNVSSFEGVEKERGSLTVVSSEYLDYPSNAFLFEPTDEYISGFLDTSFHKDISQFEDGCYRQYEKLSDAETQTWLDIMESQFDENDAELWNDPLQGNFKYYVLPGDPTVHEVK